MVIIRTKKSTSLGDLCCSSVCGGRVFLRVRSPKKKTFFSSGLILRNSAGRVSSSKSISGIVPTFDHLILRDVKEHVVPYLQRRRRVFVSKLLVFVVQGFLLKNTGQTSDFFQNFPVIQKFKRDLEEKGYQIDHRDRENHNDKTDDGITDR